MSSFCLCGENHFYEWKHNRCCDLLIEKYRHCYGNFYLWLNGNFYKFDNDSSTILVKNVYIKLEIVIDEGLPIECIRDKIIRIVNNLCFG